MAIVELAKNDAGVEMFESVDTIDNPLIAEGAADKTINADDQEERNANNSEIVGQALDVTAGKELESPKRGAPNSFEDQFE